MSSKLHLPVITYGRGGYPRNNDREDRKAMLGVITAEAPTKKQAIGKLRIAVMQWASNPVPILAMAQDGTVFIATPGIEQFTIQIRSYIGFGNMTQIGPVEEIHMEKGQQTEWVLGQHVSGYNRGAKCAV